jgi:hypothetical protein
MLKPSDPPPLPEAERPVGELVHELVESGKSYARAEVELAKATAAAKAKAFKLPAILLAAAFLLVVGAICALGVGLVLALAEAIGAIGAGLLVFVLLAAAAGGCAWYAGKRLKADL